MDGRRLEPKEPPETQATTEHIEHNNGCDDRHSGNDEPEMHTFSRYILDTHLSAE